MIGTTNIISKKGEVEKIILTLKTNQASNNDLSGVAFTLEYGSFSKDYVWSGEAIAIDVPGYMEYTVTFKDVEGYATPEPITEMAVAGSVRAVNAIYKTEIVSVTVNAINGESMVGQTVTINGTEHTWNGTAITQKIPFGTTYEVSVNDKEDYITPESQSFTASQAKRSVFMQYVDIPVTDLSKVDIYGNPVAQNTANCYVIKETGKYMFPIAYGAAIKNGAVNAGAYTKNSGANSHNFVNYKNKVITSPYVETDTAAQASSVQISIADMDNVVTGLEIVEGDGCRYVKFEVPEVPTVGANSIISIKDSKGTVMWSWLIWIWPHDLTPIEITNATSVTYNIMPVNLASTYDEEANIPAQIKNWFYQWGRPTPLHGPSYYNSNNVNTIYGVLRPATADTASNLHIGIQNPTTFYKQDQINVTFNWFSTNGNKVYNLWDAACSNVGNSDNDVIKTIYDPCPVGWKIPNGNTFTYFSSMSPINFIGSFNYGWRFKRYSTDTVGIFIPASGMRTTYSNGDVADVGETGAIWLSSAYSNQDSYCFAFSAEQTLPQYYSGRSCAYSIRPVQDSALDLPTHKLTISVTGDSSIPSGYEVKVYSVTKTTDETTGEVTETLGDILATQTTDSAIHELTWGTEYKIVASDVNGFITPEILSYVADVENRNVSLVYVVHAGTKNPSNGVYIQDTDGYFYTESEWDGTYTADCVAVITDTCQFGIALTEASDTMYIHGDILGTLENYMTKISNETQAKADYNGATNTTNIMKLQPSTSLAAGWCNAFTFPSGKNGFLPALGQIWTAYNNKAAVDAALTKAGGTAFSSEYYWTSTFWGVYSNIRNCWALNWNTSTVYYNPLATSLQVRAFCSI